MTGHGSIAAFWDFENVPIADGLTCRNLAKRMREEGEVSFFFVFANWTNYSHMQAETLHANEATLVYVPVARPNSVDTVMNHLVMQTLDSFRDLDWFVIVSGDSDFELTIDHLKRKGKAVWLISKPEATSARMIEMATRYDAIRSFSNPSETIAVRPQGTAKGGELERLRDIAVVRLYEAIESITKAENKPGVGHVKVVLKSLDFSFSEEELGFPDWTSFIDWVHTGDAIILKGKMPGTMLEIPSPMPGKYVQLRQTRERAVENIFRIVEEMLNEGMNKALVYNFDVDPHPWPLLDKRLKQVDPKVLDGFRNISDLVNEAVHRERLVSSVTDWRGNELYLTPKYSTQQILEWLRGDGRGFLASDSRIPDDSSISAISDFLWENQMTLKGLERLLRDPAIKSEYDRLMDFNNNPPIPFRLRVRIYELIRKDMLQQGSAANEWLTGLLKQAGIDGLRYP